MSKIIAFFKRHGIDCKPVPMFDTSSASFIKACEEVNEANSDRDKAMYLDPIVLSQRSTY
jgi:hypothetical protein